MTLKNTRLLQEQMKSISKLLVHSLEIIKIHSVLPQTNYTDTTLPINMHFIKICKMALSVAFFCPP